jgi:hypothetical protein
MCLDILNFAEDGLGPVVWWNVLLFNRASIVGDAALSIRDPSSSHSIILHGSDLLCSLGRAHGARLLW